MTVQINANTGISFPDGSTQATSNVYTAGNGIYLNQQQIASSFNIPAGTSAMSVGPVRMGTGISVNIPVGSRWVIL